MPALLSSVSSLTTVLAGLGLVGTVFKPIPPLVDSVQAAVGPTVNPLIAPLGISLIETSGFNSSDATSRSDDATSRSSQLSNTTSSNGTPDPRCIVEPYEVPPPTQFTFPPYNKPDADLYRYRQQQSVNLGGWFALESWMTPSMFACAGGNKTSELDFAMGWGGPEFARMMIERHWDTFITEADFAAMASLGINSVRIPIGYWSLGPAFLQGTPFQQYASVYTNAWARVVRAINLAEKYKIGVIVDVHGAPGSQNALPSSGVSNGVASLFVDPTNVHKTLAVLSFLTQQLAPVSNVAGMQVLNEPYPDPRLEQWYNMTIASLRALVPEALSLPYYIHDSFDLDRFSQFVGQRDDFVVLDHHSYFIFSPEDAATSASNQTVNVKTNVGQALLNASSVTKRNMIIGEFSCALSDAALARETNADDARRAFCTTQLATYQNITSGWHFWSWTEEGCKNDPNWCFQNVIGKSLPASFSSYEGGEPKGSRQRSGAAPSDSVRIVSDQLADAIKGLVPPQAGKLAGAAYNGTLSDVDAVGDLPVSPNSALNQANSTVTSNAGSLGLFKRFLSGYAALSRPHPRSFTFQKRGPSSAEQAISIGYSEGFETGRSFAGNNLSKLGFTNQFMSDKLADHIANKDVDASKGDYYKQWFAKGLADAEALVAQAIVAQSATGGDSPDGNETGPAQ